MVAAVQAELVESLAARAVLPAGGIWSRGTAPYPQNTAAAAVAAAMEAPVKAGGCGSVGCSISGGGGAAVDAVEVVMTTGTL